MSLFFERQPIFFQRNKVVRIIVTSYTVAVDSHSGSYSSERMRKCRPPPSQKWSINLYMNESKKNLLPPTIPEYVFFQNHPEEKRGWNSNYSFENPLKYSSFKRMLYFFLHSFLCRRKLQILFGSLVGWIDCPLFLMNGFRKLNSILIGFLGYVWKEEMLITFLE